MNENDSRRQISHVFGENKSLRSDKKSYKTNGMFEISLLKKIY